MKYVTEGEAQWHDLGDPYDNVVFPHDPKVDENCPNSDSYAFACGEFMVKVLGLISFFLEFYTVTRMQYL